MAILSVDAVTLKEWLDRGEAVLIDVREPAEYQTEHIAGSILMPMGQVTEEKLLAYEDKKLVFHCRKGGRGGSVCERVSAQNSTKTIYNLEGGLIGWAAAGLPVEHGARKHLPLDRQVQIAIGLPVLLASLLGYFVNPSFFLISGFFGMGLTFAGVTGFCGLARLLTHAPWNRCKNKSNVCIRPY